MSVEDVDEFAYDGQLVFNGIHATEVLAPEFDFDEVIESELVDFSEGSIDAPGRGYRTIPFLEFLEEAPSVERSLKDFVDDVHAFRYLEEEWEYQEVDVDGEIETRPSKTGVGSFDAYWTDENYLLIKGNKTEAKQADELLSKTLDDYLSIREVTFHPDFLLWLFAQEKNGEQLPGSLSVRMLTDAEIRGDEPDLFGQKSKVDDSTDITKSTPVLMGVLQQKGLVGLEGVFGLLDKFVRARISTEGRVHVKADHAIEGSVDVERMALSIGFLDALTGLYEHWQQLDNDQQYPPTDFFTDIYEECSRQGVDITFSIDEVIKEYRQKGGAEEWDQYQSGLGEWT